jgi:hypothetical protein
VPHTAAKPHTPAVVIERFRPVAGRTLRGHVDVTIASDHLTVHGIAILQCGDWVSIRMPAATAPRFLDLSWRDELGLQWFAQEVIAALRSAYPEALAGREVMA